MTVETLNPLSFPLYGQRLIEASAGTGKTYTISSLYLRLLLGHGDEQSKPITALTVDKILVVTFTEAATQELRERIRARIHQARLAFVRGQSDDGAIAPLLAAGIEHKTAAQLLLNAERQMDEAAIYTIHGFCQRMLTQNAFESGSLFVNEFITDESAVRERAVFDFWRREFYPLSKALAAEIRQYWDTPFSLLKEITPYLSGPLVEINAPDLPDCLEAQHQVNLNALADLKRQWLASVSEISVLIEKSGVDKRSYSKKNLPLWLEAVSAWAQTPTLDYRLPKKLHVFSAAELAEKTKKGMPPSHPIFNHIETLLACELGFKQGLTKHAIIEVRRLLKLEKQRFGWLSFDDLLSQLASALARDEQGILADRIRSLYPVAMIDEFQDTDPEQYAIFNTIYQQPSATGLFMIGDPKQAIYAFRGADIFTYINARRHVRAHYNLDTNWRSSADMVAAVNCLFSHANAPFIYDTDIPFIEVKHAPKAETRAWLLDNEKVPAITFWLNSSEPELTPEGYSIKMAQATAASICEVLNKSGQGQAVFVDKGQQRAIEAKDIAVLVRTGNEAQRVKTALAKLGIAAVYLSDRRSVFASPLATDIARFLQAVLTPENERIMRAALASRLLGFSALELDKLNQEEAAWERELIAFSTYQTLWLKRGVLAMLRHMLQQRNIAERLLVDKEGERTLTDLLHIGELLQRASQEFESPHGLIRWLVERIAEPNGNSEEQQVRLESERELVQIVTIHKSKGLEYPLVYLPFICAYRKANNPFYHDENNRSVLDLTKQKDTAQQADKERLAEDLRLLYVALTRAVFGCFIGLALLKTKASQQNSALHLSAIGYLLQQGKEKTADEFAALMMAFVDKHDFFALSPPPVETGEQLSVEDIDLSQLNARDFRGHIARDWYLTSYSYLVKQHGHGAAKVASPQSEAPLAPLLQADDVVIDDHELMAAAPEEVATAEPFSSIFQFPRGARAGTFLHTLFEKIDFQADFTSNAVVELLARQLKLENYPIEWLPVLQQLLRSVLSTPLEITSADDTLNALRLDHISKDHKLVEMEFVMPVTKLDCSMLNLIVKAEDPLSAQAGELDFARANGMLKGFIDLIFCWQGRYYVLDWKSNYLGAEPQAYHQQALEQAMIEHRYDFQYHIYTLALHRFLASRLADYDYERHVGGVFYLFVRGMEPSTQHGVFYTRPTHRLITQLDALFSGENQTAVEV